MSNIDNIRPQDCRDFYIYAKSINDLETYIKEHPEKAQDERIQEDLAVYKTRIEMGKQHIAEFPFECYLYGEDLDDGYKAVKYFKTFEEAKTWAYSTNYTSYLIGTRDKNGYFDQKEAYKIAKKEEHLAEDITTLTDKIDKADNDLEELIKSLNKTIQEALEEDVESLEKKVNKADDDLKTIIKTLKENFKASDFEDLNLHDIHYHGTNKDGTLDFICYELQGKDLKRTVLYKDADVEVYAYTDTLDKKEVHLMIKPIIELTADDIERIAIDAKEQLDKKLK